MRETVSLALSYGRRELPVSLMQRLEHMQHLALVAKAQAAGQTPRQSPPRGARRGAHVVVLAWFSLGVIASGAMGAGAVVWLRTLAAGDPSAVVAPAVASWSHPRADWDTVHVTLDRGQRMRAPLALQVTGANGGAFEVVMHGLPAGVRPSRGAPFGEGTWMLKPADLDGLYLTLDDTVADAFDVKIAVLTSTGIATAGSIVQVRLVEMAPATQAAVTVGVPVPPAPPVHAGMLAGEAAAAKPGPAAAPALTRTATQSTGRLGAPAQRRTGPVVASTGRTMPEGAYALGAIQREPEQQASWWQMPPPTWSPFLVGQEQP
jgi:hypothetical protein